MSDSGIGSEPEPSLDRLIELYDSDEALTPYDEVVTELEHALQSAALAQQDEADDRLIAAALLHDIGHLILRDNKPIDEALTVDHRHDRAGADFLEAVFGPSVADPVRLHVSAKRYLCAVDEEYLGLLSASSIRSLSVQGGPMTEDEVARFEQLPGCEQAVQVRRWDDQAKVAGLDVASFGSWVPMLKTLLA
jgi:gamma-butyrobetaine dioxygenase